MKKIMFNDRYGLTEAVIIGAKTMTRRMVPDEVFTFAYNMVDDTLVYENEYGDFIDVRKSRYAHYKAGEVVAVAQSYERVYHNEGLETMDMLLSGMKTSAGWKNKMFVKPNLMSYYIGITDVRVEHLQDISDDDCLKEGIENLSGMKLFGFSEYLPPEERLFGYASNTHYFTDAREAFACLIDKVCGAGTWEKNPFVFVYRFHRVIVTNE